MDNAVPHRRDVGGESKPPKMIKDLGQNLAGLGGGAFQAGLDGRPSTPEVYRQVCFATVRGDCPGEDSGERFIVGVQGEFEGRGTDIEREDHLPARAMRTIFRSRASLIHRRMNPVTTMLSVRTPAAMISG